MPYLNEKPLKKLGKGSENDGTEFWRSKFVEFCKRTDLHGYKYIVMEDLSAVERSCWSITIVVSVAVAIYFVITAYRWYARNPIVTVIESTQGAIWDVPFPAVTICDLNMVSRKAALALANNLSLPKNVTSDFIFKSFRIAPLLHAPFAITSDQRDQLGTLQRILDLNNMSVDAMFKRISPASSCNQLVQKCMWKNTVYRCDQLFQQIFTIFNVCCTFNYYAEKDTRGRNHKSLYSLSTPRRVASCGYQTALTVKLSMNTDDYYSSSIAAQGAMVLIDSAYNFPNQDSPARIVNPSTEVLIALSPERTYTTSGIKSFHPSQRQCYYSNEVDMKEFAQYSLHNCMALQKYEELRVQCGCVPLFLPFSEGSRTCNFSDLECMQNVLRPIPVSPCLPECEHFDYIIEGALGVLAKNIKIKGLPFFKNTSLDNCSLLNVFFNDLVSTRYRRDVYLNWQNILAAFGGLLSLMLGFTLISGFDLVLFIITRVGLQPFKQYMLSKMALRKQENVIIVKDKSKRVNNWIDNQALRHENLKYSKQLYRDRY